MQKLWKGPRKEKWAYCSTNVGLVKGSSCPKEAKGRISDILNGLALYSFSL